MGTVQLVNQQQIHIDTQKLTLLWQQAWSLVVQHPAGPLGSQLTSLPEIVFVLLDDEEITAVHGQFLDDPTPTDVITFHHGEVLISVDTAAHMAPQQQTTLFSEVLLYGIHGLVHLHGYDDKNSSQRTIMESIQTPIWQQLK